MNGNYKIIAQTQIGPYHIKNNIPNQDSFAFKIYKSLDLVVGAVSDGMGSRKYSHIGSKELTKLVVKQARLFYSKKRFEKKLLKQWLLNIRPYKQNETLSTLMCVIIKNNKIYIAKVGDGTIVILGKKDKILDDDKYFANLTTAFSLEKLQWWEFEKNEVDTIFLATDGISDDIDNKFKFVKDFTNYFFKYNRNKELKNILKNWPVKGHSDDKTLMCIKNEK